MAFDPIQEDCLRLILASMEREQVFPLEDAPFIEQAMEAYRKDPSSLIHTDSGRAFNLVARATESIDYRVPFVLDPAEADRLEGEAESQLREAVELDPGNWDAQRMLVALTAKTNADYVSYLRDNEQAVLADTERACADTSTPYAREYSGDLARRPYLRWLAALASRSFIAGQYRISLDAAERCLAFDATDPADVRYTAVLALAKLEADPEDIERFRERHAEAYPMETGRGGKAPARVRPDAWTLIAKMNLAYRELDLDGATKHLRALMRAYPRAAQPLFYQAEFPDGVFSRISVAPGSEDELVLAISEATPLLQEGVGAPDIASFSLWVSDHELVQEQMSLPQAGDGLSLMRRQGGDN